MGRAADFAKRRVAGYIIFWLVVLFFLYVLYNGQQPTQAAGLFIISLAVTISMAVTRRIKRKQRERREATRRG